LIARFEALAQQVWPPAELQTLGGWRLGFSDGCTKRANSVQTSTGWPGDCRERIEQCEARYRARGLPVIFKLTAGSRPPDLDRLLDARGYRLVDPTSVRVCEALPEGALETNAEARVLLEPSRSRDFFEACVRLNGVAAEHRSALAGIFDRIAATCEGVVFASISEGSQTHAQGIGVLQGGALCLCEIATRPDQRRRGLATRLVRVLCQWAGERAALPWLQVVAANHAASALYDALGFRETHRYWYRVSD